MATLKSKRKQETKIEELDKKVKDSVSQEDSEYMNEAEHIALSEQHENDVADSKKVSTVKMEKAVEVVQDMFNLSSGNFTMNGFADKGGKCQVSLSNEDFDLVVLVKDTEKYGIN